MSDEVTNALSLQTPLSSRAVDTIVARHDPLRARWHARDGFLLAVVERARALSGREDLHRHVRTAVDGLIDEGGRIASYRQEDYDLGMIGPGRCSSTSWTIRATIGMRARSRRCGGSSAVNRERARGILAPARLPGPDVGE